MNFRFKALQEDTASNKVYRKIKREFTQRIKSRNAFVES